MHPSMSRLPLKGYYERGEVEDTNFVFNRNKQMLTHNVSSTEINSVNMTQFTTQGAYVSDGSVVGRDKAGKNLQDLIAKHESLRIKNVEEKINSYEVNILKVHDQSKISAKAVEELCQVYTQSLSQLMTVNPQIQQLLSETDKRAFPYPVELKSILKRVGDGFD